MSKLNSGKRIAVILLVKSFEQTNWVIGKPYLLPDVETRNRISGLPAPIVTFTLPTGPEHFYPDPDSSIFIHSGMVYLLLLSNLLTLIIAAFLIGKEKKKRRQKDDRLQNNEKLFRALIEHSSDVIIVIDAQGIDRYASPSVTRVLGYTPEELSGKSQYHLHHPDDRRTLKECFRSIEKVKGGAQKLTWRFLHKDGSWRTLEAIASNQLDNPLIQGIVMNVRDVTENKALEEKVRKSEEWFRALIENMYDLIQVLDPKGHAIFSSPSLERTMGYTAEDLRHKRPFDFIHADDQPQVAADFNDMLRHPDSTRFFQYRFHHKNGEVRYLETFAWNKLNNDAVRGTIAITRDVTRQKLAEQEMQSALSLLKAIFNSTAEGIMAVDSNRQVVSYNEKFAQSWGIPDEVLASGEHKRIVSIAMRHVKDPQGFREQIERIYATPEESGELTAELLDGRVMECYSQPQLIDGKAVGRVWSNRDITERKRSEKQLLKIAKLDHLLSEVSRTFIEEDIDAAIHFTLELLSDFGDLDRSYVFRYQSDGSTLFCSHQWKAEGEPQAGPVFQNKILTDDYHWLHRQIQAGNVIHAASLDELPQEAAPCKALFQKDRVLSVLIMPMMLNNQAIGFIGYDSLKKPKRWTQDDIQVLQVITEILTNALAKSDAEKQLKEAKEVAEQANRSKSEFLANLSHEIRTPMNAVLGFAELLSKDDLNEKQKHYLQAIRSSGNNLLSLINDILDLSKIEAEKLEIQNAPVHLRSVLREMESVFSVNTREKNLDFIIEVDPDLPDGLLLDEIRLRQILFNLVGNAVKFTERGYVKMSARKEMAENSQEGINLIIEIEDTGIGIKADQLGIIFEAFQQQSGQSVRRFGGTGLGLAITRRLVEMMQGKISVRSTVGKGSVFQVCLQNIALTSWVEPTDKKVLDNEPEVEFLPARILVADDLEMNRELVKGYLKDSSLTVLEAENGEVALEMVRRHRPQVVMMDIKMPVLDGYGAVRKIKSDPALARTRIIALTAQILEEDKKKIMDEGFDDYLAKPVSKKQLLGKLRSFLPHVPIHRQVVLEPKDPVEELTEETRARIPGLVNELRSELLPVWEESRRKFIITQIEAFAERVKAKGESYQLPILTHYGIDLLGYSSNFDMEQLPQSLARFPDIIEKIEQL